MIVKMVPAEKPEGITPFDAATIALGAATVVLTGVAVIMAIAAIWGYKEIKEALIRAAENKAEIAAKDKAEVVAARTIAEWISASRETHDVVDNPGNGDDA